MVRCVELRGILPRSLHLPLASTDGSSTRNFNKTGVRLWTESSYAPDAKRIEVFVKSSFAQVPYSVFRRHLGMNTTVVLAAPTPSHSDSRLCPSGCVLSCAWRLTSEVSTMGTLPQMLNVYCLPGRAGGPPGDARPAAKVAPFAHREHLVWTRTFGNHRCAARSPVK